MITAQACSEPLGPAQTIAVEGPDCGPEMFTYVCTGCNQKFPDTGLYFYGVSSTRCIWCTKFPKGKKI
jgi:hypothetical protein